MNVVIAGVGHFLPEKIVTNDELSLSINTNDEWINTRTGIRQRHIAAEDCLTSDLACEALKLAMAQYNIAPSQLDGIILATVTPDLFMPATAVKVQQAIGMNCGFAFDVQAACSGFIYALNIAYSMLKSGQAKRIAVIGAETMSRILDWNDRSTCVLFGDGAGAVIVSAEEEEDAGIIGIEMFSDMNTLDILKVNGGVSIGNLDAKLQMNGREVYKFAIESMHNSILHVLHKNNMLIEHVDFIIPHQANLRIIKSLAEKMQMPMEKFIITVDKHANTSAASIPLALSLGMQNGVIKKGHTVLMTAVGAGMTWGSVIVKI